LQKLTPEQVRRFYAKKSNEGLSSKTIGCLHNVFHLALSNAVLWNYVPRNVCDLVKPPRIRSRKGTPLNPEQARQLVASARQHHLDVLLMVAVVTGMRRGELLALRWANVNFTRRTLVVIHTVDYIPHYGYVETETKTEAGKRSLSLPNFLVEMLFQHRNQQQEQRRKQGDKWENRDLVFPDRLGGYFNPNYLLRVFKKVLQQAGIPHLPFHDLRHSAATILLGWGVNIKVIQQILGHSDIAITLGLYSHLLPPMQQEATDKWEKEFGEDEKNQDS